MFVSCGHKLNLHVRSVCFYGPSLYCTSNSWSSTSPAWPSPELTSRRAAWVWIMKEVPPVRVRARGGASQNSVRVCVGVGLKKHTNNSSAEALFWSDFGNVGIYRRRGLIRQSWTERQRKGGWRKMSEMQLRGWKSNNVLLVRLQIERIFTSAVLPLLLYF